MKKLIYSQEDLDLILSLEIQEYEDKINNLQSKIDKAIELGDKIIQEHEELVGLTGNLVLNFKQVLNILKEDK